jgi:antitoxin component of MazEF toxin-antitoxin module
MYKPDFSAMVAHDARVFKSGNSLAVRIPSAIARYCELEDGVTLEIAAGEGMIFLRRVPEKSLDELIDEITTENVVPDLFPGPMIGGERW